MRTAIVYYSAHHGNTRRLAEAIAQGRDVTLIDALAAKSADLIGYDLIGFASGIYFGKFHQSVVEFIDIGGQLPLKGYPGFIGNFNFYHTIFLSL